MKARILQSSVRAKRHARAAFTLLEIMIVIMMIGVLAAMGIPSIISQMRDRRTNQAAHEVALIYRRARSMAMGRGTAVLVRFTSVGQGTVEMLEARQTAANHENGTCAPLPSRSCLTNSWVSGTDNRVVSTFQPGPGSAFEGVNLQFFSTDNSGGTTSVASADVCFTPMGRSYMRIPGDAFSPLTSVPYVDVSRSDGIGSTRSVLVLPNGTSRLSL